MRRPMSKALNNAFEANKIEEVAKPEPVMRKPMGKALNNAFEANNKEEVAKPMAPRKKLGDNFLN